MNNIEKKITITILNNKACLISENINPIEMLGILRFYEKDCWLQIQKHTSEINKLNEKKLYYKFSLSDFISAEINILDEIEIMSSEFCVTNNDKIKYDERISNERGIIKSINLFDNVCLIDFNNKTIKPAIIPITWLKFIKRNK